MRYYPWGSTHYSNGTQPRRQYTGQMNDGDTGLYYYNARYYEPGLARFVQADTIVPDSNNPQLYNRYSYVGNSPLNYVDPSGYDLMIVTGGNGDEYIGVPDPWKEWIMAYKGWSETEWTDFLKGWNEAHNKADYTNDFGIRFFDWAECKCVDKAGELYSTEASVDWAVGNLNEQMKGMKDITLLGYSKGANVVLHYANYNDVSEEILNIISLNAPQTDFFWLAASNSKFIDRVKPSSERSFTVTNIYNPYDSVNSYGNGYVENALNVSYIRQGSNITDFSPHALNGKIAPFILYEAINIVGNANASTRNIGRH